LDVTIQSQILDLMNELRDKQDTTILMITHDLGVVSEICDRVIVMYAGTVVEEGETEKIFENPEHPYTEGLIKSMPKIGSKQSPLCAISVQLQNTTMIANCCKYADRCSYVMDICRE